MVITPKHCKGLCAYRLDTKVRSKHITLSYPWSWAYISMSKEAFKTCWAHAACSNRDGEAGQGGLWGQEGQRCTSLFLCTEIRAARATFLMIKMLQLYANIFESSLTLDLSWQRMYLPWPGLQAHWNCTNIWCPCIVQCSLRILSPDFDCKNTLLLILLDFLLTNKQYFLYYSSQKSCCFLTENQDFMTKLWFLAEGNLFLSCATQSNKI